MDRAVLVVWRRIGRSELPTTAPRGTAVTRSRGRARLGLSTTGTEVNVISSREDDNAATSSVRSSRNIPAGSQGARRALEHYFSDQTSHRVSTFGHRQLLRRLSTRRARDTKSMDVFFSFLASHWVSTTELPSLHVAWVFCMPSPFCELSEGPGYFWGDIPNSVNPLARSGTAVFSANQGGEVRGGHEACRVHAREAVPENNVGCTCVSTLLPCYISPLLWTRVGIEAGGKVRVRVSVRVGVRFRL